MSWGDSRPESLGFSLVSSSNESNRLFMLCSKALACPAVAVALSVEWVSVSFSSSSGDSALRSNDSSANWIRLTDQINESKHTIDLGRINSGILVLFGAFLVVGIKQVQQAVRKCVHLSICLDLVNSRSGLHNFNGNSRILADLRRLFFRILGIGIKQIQQAVSKGVYLFLGLNRIANQIR